MIDIPLFEYDNNDDNDIYLDNNFSILSFNLNVGGMGLNKDYHDDEIKNVHSPNFFKSIESKILIGHPNIIVIVTEGDLDKETYFHSHFLPDIMNKLKYRLLIRDKNSKNDKMGIVRMSIYIRYNDASIKNVQLNKKAMLNNNIYISNTCVSLVLYIQTLLGLIAFIGICSLDKNIIEIENKFIKDKLIDYVFILGDLPNIKTLNNYERSMDCYQTDDFFQHGRVFFHYKTNRIENIVSSIIKDDNIGFKTKCNLGLLGFYYIITEDIKSINVFNTDKFPKFCLSDKIDKNFDKNVLFDIGISHNSTFFVSDDKIFVNVDNEKQIYEDKFFLQGKTSDFNGYWIIENKKDIKYNDFLELDTYNNDIQSFSTGYEHIIFLSKLGKLYGLGNNKYGQLGLPISKIYYYFKEIEINDVLLIQCGAFHTIINTKSGLYSFGNNMFGQLGIKEKYLLCSFTPIKININLKVKDISCGDYHTIILTDKGDIYGFGANKYGQLGLDDDDNVIFPTKLNISNVLSTSCGDNYSVINSRDGLYVFYNKQDKNIHKINLKDVLIISCSRDYFLVFTEEGLFGINLNNLIPITIKIQNTSSITCGFNKSIIQTKRNNFHIYMFHNILNNSMIQYTWDVI